MTLRTRITSGGILLARPSLTALICTLMIAISVWRAVPGIAKESKTALAIAVEKTVHERYYNETYMDWQLPLNKIGAMYKKRYWRDYVTHDMACAEFGCSTGFILHSMPCREKLGIELNDAARDYAHQKFALNVVQTTSEVLSSSQDFILSTSVLEHAECPICELRQLHRILKPHGIISVTVPGMAPRSMVWKRDDVNLEFQMFGALELGNLLIAAGFTIPDPNACFSEVTQWPPDAEEIFKKNGLDTLIERAKEYGRTHDNLVTTWCIAYKE